VVEVGDADRVTEVRDVYPQVGYLNAFDIAISSAGYNAVHELVPAGVPSLFVANTSTRTDDQETRSRRLDELGLGLGARDIDPAAIATGVAKLLDPKHRQDIAAAAAATRSQITGAAETARMTVNLGSSFTRRKRTPAAVLSQQVQLAKESMKDALGEERTNALKRMLGREATPEGEKVRVRIVDHPQLEGQSTTTPLAVTTSLSRPDLELGTPIEHLLPGSSAAYRERRIAMIEAYYEVESQ
jgi:hypothetical protein